VLLLLWREEGTRAVNQAEATALRYDRLHRCYSMDRALGSLD